MAAEGSVKGDLTVDERHREIVGLLYGLTTEHPTWEKLHRQLMLAPQELYHSILSIRVEDARLVTPAGPI
ncbi:BTAD domain-containing putative transcriptional regulator [Frankia sp. R82]|uniref:BTAD domain-containing putative transcriptional regulator n=1 Tax=Frankia sp. R82 TaxID=2950553 RepID=UPI0020439971|nr:BTAD domain-containing putative transcriptional regulator [Frankia sp. R82]MCM3884050.1 hypothetical protein [Frankia sp. R82]